MREDIDGVIGPIAHNLTQLRTKIALAAEGAGRPSASVRLVAVTKGHPLPSLLEAFAAGQREFGENYVQEWEQKRGGSPSEVAWHFIGALQRRKLKSLVGHVSLIHSVEELAQLQAIDRLAAEKNIEQPCLIEVNVSGEGSKHGIRPEELKPLLQEAAPSRRAKVIGLMAMTPLSEDPGEVRPLFRHLKELQVVSNEEGWYMTPLEELSMGMTSDFIVAIEEGATLVRIGTAIFGERVKSPLPPFAKGGDEEYPPFKKGG